MTRIGYLGPAGTFTEQAILTQPDLATADLVASDTIADVIVATHKGEVDLGFCPIENAIEGTVNVAADMLAFEHELLIQREVVIDIHFHLLARPGTELDQVTRVLSHPVGLAQVRGFLRRTVPQAEIRGATSTAEAARLVGTEAPPGSAAVGNALAGELYGLVPLASDIADHPGNQTRFVLIARQGVPAPSGHDKTSIVVYQRADAPGSLLAILQEFAARRINLVKLESRPTRQGLGDYCFLLDLEGHIADPVVGDCLRSLHAKQERVKFLGSYPAAGERSDEVRADNDQAWHEAGAWLESLRSEIR